VRAGEVKASVKTSVKASVRIFSLFITSIIFSGIDIVGKLMVIWLGWPGYPCDRLERWNRELEYSANTALLYWVPNQALAGWISGGLAIYALLSIRQPRISWLPLGLSALWTPFVTIGLAPFMLAEFLRARGPLFGRL